MLANNSGHDGRGHVPILDMSNNSADHLTIALLHLVHFWHFGSKVWVYLSKQYHDGVVEKTGYDS